MLRRYSICTKAADNLVMVVGMCSAWANITCLHVASASSKSAEQHGGGWGACCAMQSGSDGPETQAASGPVPGRYATLPALPQEVTDAFSFCGCFLRQLHLLVLLLHVCKKSHLPVPFCKTCMIAPSAVVCAITMIPQATRVLRTRVCHDRSASSFAKTTLEWEVTNTASAHCAPHTMSCMSTESSIAQLQCCMCLQHV